MAASLAARCGSCGPGARRDRGSSQINAAPTSRFQRLRPPRPRISPQALPARGRPRTPARSAHPGGDPPDPRTLCPPGGRPPGPPHALPTRGATPRTPARSAHPGGDPPDPRTLCPPGGRPPGPPHALPTRGATPRAPRTLCPPGGRPPGPPARSAHPGGDPPDPLQKLADLAAAVVKAIDPERLTRGDTGPPRAAVPVWSPGQACPGAPGGDSRLRFSRACALRLRR